MNWNVAELMDLSTVPRLAEQNGQYANVVITSREQLSHRSTLAESNRMTRRTSARAVTPSRTFWNARSEEHTSELQSLAYLVCRLLLQKKKKIKYLDT